MHHYHVFVQVIICIHTVLATDLAFVYKHNVYHLKNADTHQPSNPEALLSTPLHHPVGLYYSPAAKPSTDGGNDNKDFTNRSKNSAGTGSGHANSNNTNYIGKTNGSANANDSFLYVSDTNNAKAAVFSCQLDENGTVIKTEAAVKRTFGSSWEWLALDRQERTLYLASSDVSYTLLPDNLTQAWPPPPVSLTSPVSAGPTGVDVTLPGGLTTVEAELAEASHVRGLAMDHCGRSVYWSQRSNEVSSLYRASLHPAPAVPTLLVRSHSYLQGITYEEHSHDIIIAETSTDNYTISSCSFYVLKTAVTTHTNTNSLENAQTQYPNQVDTHTTAINTTVTDQQNKDPNFAQKSMSRSKSINETVDSLDQLISYDSNLKISRIATFPHCYPFALASDAHYIYWSDWAQEGIMRLNKNNPSDVVRLVVTNRDESNAGVHYGAYGVVLLEKDVGCDQNVKENVLLNGKYDGIVVDPKLTMGSEEVESRTSEPDITSTQRIPDEKDAEFIEIRLKTAGDDSLRRDPITFKDGATSNSIINEANEVTPCTGLCSTTAVNIHGIGTTRYNTYSTETNSNMDSNLNTNTYTNSASDSDIDTSTNADSNINSGLNTIAVTHSNSATNNKSPTPTNLVSPTPTNLVNSDDDGIDIAVAAAVPGLIGSRQRLEEHVDSELQQPLNNTEEFILCLFSECSHDKWVVVLICSLALLCLVALIFATFCLIWRLSTAHYRYCANNNSRDTNSSTYARTNTGSYDKTSDGMYTKTSDGCSSSTDKYDYNDMNNRKSKYGRFDSNNCSENYKYNNINGSGKYENSGYYNNYIVPMKGSGGDLEANITTDSSGTSSSYNETDLPKNSCNDYIKTHRVERNCDNYIEKSISVDNTHTNYSKKTDVDITCNNYTKSCVINSSHSNDKPSYRYKSNGNDPAAVVVKLSSPEDDVTNFRPPVKTTETKRFGPRKGNIERLIPKSLRTWGSSSSGAGSRALCPSGTSHDGLVINIEDCCQMTLCETPCYTSVQREGRNYLKGGRSADDRAGLLDDGMSATHTADF